MVIAREFLLESLRELDTHVERRHVDIAEILVSAGKEMRDPAQG